jgi:hypothetical protein
LLDRAEELEDEAALPDPWLADQRQELGRVLLPDALERPLEQLELALAAHQRRPRLDDVDTEPGTGLQRLPDIDRLGLPLRFDRGRIAVLDRLSRRPVGRPIDKHTADGRRRLQPGRRIDHVAGSHPLALARARAERDQRLTGRDPDPHLQPGTLLRQPVPDRERRPHRPLRIVLVSHRRPEQRHHRIADELLDRAPEPLQLIPKARIVRREQRTHVLGVEPLGARRKADQVGKQDRDHLALLVHGARRSGRQGSTAKRAKRELARHLLDATRAGRHPPSLGHRIRETRPAGSVLPPARPTVPHRSPSRHGEERFTGLTKQPSCACSGHGNS